MHWSGVLTLYSTGMAGATWNCCCLGMFCGVTSALVFLWRGWQYRWTCSRDCGPVWHGLFSGSLYIPALVSMCWSRWLCPVLQRKIWWFVAAAQGSEWFRTSSFLEWVGMSSWWCLLPLKEMGCCGCCSLLLAFAETSACSFHLMPRWAGIHCTGMWLNKDRARRTQHSTRRKMKTSTSWRRKILNVTQRNCGSSPSWGIFMLKMVKELEC